ncbi:MAG TPA: CAP domain-containing protein [Trebonia sp.]
MDRGTQSRLVRLIPPAVLAMAVVAGGSFYLARGVFSDSPAAARTTVNSPATGAGCGASAGDCAASPGDVTVAVAPAVVTVPPRQVAARARQATARPTPSARTTARSSRPTMPAIAPVGTGPSTSAVASAPAGTPTVAQGGTAAAQVLALINQARSRARLAPLTVASGLQASSSAHNLKMAGGCGLSHQCPGEPAIGDRETAAGVHWTAAGENIGEGGPVADTDSAIAQMAVGLTQSMLDEQPPNDGHRMNILSTSFARIGIAVYRDGSGTVWLTQDFSN